MANQNIRIRLKSFDNALLDNSVKKILNAVLRTGSKVCGPIPLPMSIKRFTVLRSPHKDKKSREQFEIRKYKRVIDIVEPNPQTIDSLMKLEIPAGVEVEIKV